MTTFAAPSFRLTLEEAGWAILDVVLGDDTLRIDRISYLTAALDDLLVAGLHLSFGYWQETVTFDNEGWRTELRFTTEWIDRPEPIGDDGIYADPRLRVSVVELDRGEEKLLLTGLCETRDVVAAALLEVGENVWSELGAEEYDRRWISSGFPNRALDALRASLAVQPCEGREDRE